MASLDGDEGLESPRTPQPTQPQGAALGTSMAVGLGRGVTSTAGRLDLS